VVELDDRSDVSVPPPLESDADAARVLLPHPDATCEVRAEDVLEAVDLRKGSRVVYRNARQPTSIAPVALDADDGESAGGARGRRRAFGPDDSLSGARRLSRPPPNKRLVVTVAGAMGLCVVILGAAAIRSAVSRRSPDSFGAAAERAFGPAQKAHAGERTDETTKTTAAASAVITTTTTKASVAHAATAAAKPPPASPRSAPAPASTYTLPSEETAGTIDFPRHVVVTLDGARVTAGSAVVRCGEHTIRLGRGAPRKVDVPCGGTLEIPPAKGRK
jgi:hypothetical protein